MADNRPENLELWLRARPPGQRLSVSLRRWREQYPAEVEKQFRRRKD